MPNSPKTYSSGGQLRGKGSRSGVLTENSSGSVITGETGLAHTGAALLSAFQIQKKRNHCCMMQLQMQFVVPPAWRGWQAVTVPPEPAEQEGQGGYDVGETMAGKLTHCR